MLPTFIFEQSSINVTNLSMDQSACDSELIGNTTSTITCCSELYFNLSSTMAPSVIDLIQGTGWVEYTFMFYGYYTNRIYRSLVSEKDLVDNFYIRNSSEATSDLFINTSHLERVEEEMDMDIFYNLPLAYILITIVYVMLSLILMVKSAARGFKERLVEGEGQFYHYCNIVFGGWDFCIQNEKSAIIKHKALYNELKGSLQTEKLEEERQNRTRDEKTRLFCLRGTINLIVFTILIFCGIFIYYVFKFSWDRILEFKEQGEETENILKFLNSGNNLEHLIFQFLPSITIVMLNMAIPIIFKFLIQFENYSPEFVIRLSLVRIVFLRLSSLGVLMATIYYLVGCPLEPKDICVSKKCKTPLCWETYVGQQIYKLVITDFATHLLMTFLINFPRSLLSNHFENKFIQFIGLQEFELTKHVLDVVYTQTLCWLGSFFCPILPAVVGVCFFFMFYIKKFACLVNSTPSSTVYRASRSNSLFMFVLLISFVVAVVPLGISIAELTPSKSCGPFRGLTTVWQMVINTFLELPHWIRSVMFFFGTAGFAVPLFIVLVLLLYYYHAVNTANKHMVVVLKNQLVLEGHDKQFLLNRLSAFIKQQQEYQKKIRNAEMQRERERALNSSN